MYFVASCSPQIFSLAHCFQNIEGYKMHSVALPRLPLTVALAMVYSVYFLQQGNPNFANLYAINGKFVINDTLK